MPPYKLILTDDVRQLLSSGAITIEQVSASAELAFRRLQQRSTPKFDTPTTPGPASRGPAIRAALRKLYPKGLEGKYLPEVRNKVRQHLKDRYGVLSVDDKTLRRHGVRKPKG